MLKGKKILLGVTGSIAAYKAALLARLFVKNGADIKVLMTHAAKDFITPLTLATLSKNPVLSEFVKDDTGQWNNHVALGLWADAFLLAPASSNTLASMANGISNNLLTATYLSTRGPVFIAPAMDLDMYAHPSTTQNLDKLRAYGHHIIDAEFGELASGLTGTGRMAEPEHIVEDLSRFFLNQNRLEGKTVLVTAGPTQEAIDPVRFIGNHSSGKMGYAIAEKIARLGAKVNLVSGPTSLKATHPSTTQNLDKLRAYGHHIIDAEFGELASGLTGTGRMAEPEHIVEDLSRFFLNQNRLEGKTVLVTAGPTQEAIDPVRFIGNHSSGKMGYAIAEKIARLGAKVNLVSGPTSLKVTR